MKNKIVPIIIIGLLSCASASASDRLNRCTMDVNIDNTIGYVLTRIASQGLLDFHILSEHHTLLANMDRGSNWIRYFGIKVGFETLQPDPTFKCDLAIELGAYTLKYGYPVQDTYHW
jgi:hypothetical protein